MNGMELSKNYYYEVLEPRIRSRCPRCLDRIAVGLFGYGSQCLGFDDEVSRDHDWGLRVCILLSGEDYPTLYRDLEAVLREAPSQHRGVETSWESLGTRGGVLETDEWFRDLWDGKEIPRRPVDWLAIREHELLLATNGEIWHDGPGEVTQLRRSLAYYPEDVWKKRVAAKCAEISQSSGNVSRSLKRGDTVAAWFALGRFARDAMQMWFLLNGKYAPFYKWLYRAFKDLPTLPEQMPEDILHLAGPMPHAERGRTATRILGETRKAMDLRFPFTTACERFYHVAYAIQESITDAEVRSCGGVWDQIDP